MIKKQKTIMMFFALIGISMFVMGCGKILSGEKNTADDDPLVEMLVKSEPMVENSGPKVFNRNWEEITLEYPESSVEHTTLYLQGPFEHQGSEDGKFENWGVDDILSMLASPAIFIGNVILTPIEAIITPPWNSARSRGDLPILEPAYELDAKGSDMTANESY